MDISEEIVYDHLPDYSSGGMHLCAIRFGTCARQHSIRFPGRVSGHRRQGGDHIKTLADSFYHKIPEQKRCL